MNIIQEISEANKQYLKIIKETKNQELNEEQTIEISRLKMKIDFLKIVKTMFMEECVKNNKMIDNLIKEGKLSTHEEELNQDGKIVKVNVLDQSMDERIALVPEDIQIPMLEKMAKAHVQNIEIYKNSNKLVDLAKEEYELEVINGYLPKEASKEDVVQWLNENYPNGISQKEMGLTIKAVKENFNRVDGKMVSEIVRSIIK